MERINISAGHSPKAPLRARVSCLLGSVLCFLSSVTAGTGALSLSVTLATHVCLVIEVKKKWSCTSTGIAELTLGVVSDSASKFR